MTVKIPNWLLFSILVGTGILIFALIRGCNNSKSLQLSNINYKEEIKRHKEDSIKNVQYKIAYNDSIEFLDGQLSLSQNKEIFLNENLDKANARITNLLSKHVPIKPSPYDTGSTVVPNDYIVDCHDCFEELGNGQQLVRKYKAEKDNQEQIYKGQLNVKDNRINHLEKANKEVTSSYMALIDITKDAGKNRRMIYFSYGVLWSAYVPKSVGAGLMYQDKRLRQFGVKGYFGAHKTMIETQVNMPLSFKKR